MTLRKERLMEIEHLLVSLDCSNPTDPTIIKLLAALRDYSIERNEVILPAMKALAEDVCLVNNDGTPEKLMDIYFKEQWETFM